MADKKQLSVIFGEVLQELRQNREWTQDYMAERAHTERSHISALERAEKGPSLNTLFSIAEALEISAAELVAAMEKKLKSRHR